ncbi:MAG TPA: hypothetical protein DFR83_07895 [Deltaproteobacteria bacterium]|nr:hypothetical protein [Deltaproteobacteria bacterium]
MSCATERAPEADRNVAAVSELLDALDVERTLSLALDPESALQLDQGCQAEPVASARANGPMPVEEVTRWEGPCQLQDGAMLEGSLTLTRTADSQVLSAESLAIVEQGSVEVLLSGAMEMSRIDDLVELNVAMHGCGALGGSCGSTSPPSTVGIDLEYSIFPMDTYPRAYSVSVGGAVDGETMIVSVEGAWKTEQTLCDTEPIEGSLVLDTLPRQTLTLEGSGPCDGCVGWQVEGVAVAPFCLENAW